MFTPGRADTQGVLARYANELAVTAPGTNTARVATGAAIVHGTFYESTANVDLTIPTPAAATRVDYIVARKSWAGQTVRAYRIVGTEGAGVPALVQTNLTTWDIPLAEVSITIAGTITLTDRRRYTPTSITQRTATLTVAAYNASYKSRDVADYLCDGTADDVQIQAALDIVAAVGGGSVQLSEGTFNCTTGLTIDDSVVLCGTGWGSVLTLPAGTNPANFTMITNEHYGVSANERLGVQNLCIDVNQSNNTGALRGVDFQDSSLVYIANVLVIDSEYHAIRILGACNYVTIGGCLVGFGDTTNGVGIGIINDGADVPRFVQLVGNSVDSMAVGIDVSGSNTVTVASNTITNCATYGIRGYGGYGYAIQGNSIVGGAGDGIILDNAAAGVTVGGNTVTNVGGHGILVNGSSYNNINGNVVSSPGLHGIVIDDSSQNIISENQIYNASQDVHNTSSGINITDNSDNNNVHGNLIRHAGGANQPKYGIELDDAASNTNNIHDNDIDSSGATANLVNGGTGTLLRRNRGWATENSGTATITSPATTIAVTHGLNGTPTRVLVTPSSTLTNADWWWVDTLGATQFTIHVDQDPGANPTFHWRAAVGEENT